MGKLVMSFTKIKMEENNMKKIIALLLVAVMAMGMAACGATQEAAPTTTAAANNDTVDTTPADTTPADTTPADTTPAAAENTASAVLSTIWGKYAEDEKFFAMGGDFNAMVDGAPGVVDVTNTDFLQASLLVPEAQWASVTEAASLIHGMNANTFTCGAYVVADAAAFAEAMKAAIQGNQWMCGFPETLLVANVDGVVVVVFGLNDAVNPFQTHLTEAYANAEILINEAIAA